MQSPIIWSNLVHFNVVNGKVNWWNLILTVPQRSVAVWDWFSCAPRYEICCSSIVKRTSPGRIQFNLTELEQSLSCLLTPRLTDRCSRTTNMDIFPLIICTISCQWALPYWQLRICMHVRDSRECDVFVQKMATALLSSVFKYSSSMCGHCDTSYFMQ